MAKQHVVYITDCPPISPWPVLFAIAVIVVFWQWVLVALAVAVLAGCLGLTARWWRDGVDAQMRVDAGLRRRADEQHSALLSGDLMRGRYGEHPPANLG